MTTQPGGERVHHSLPAHDVLLMLGTDPRRGLTAAEADDRLQRFGPNVLPRAAPTSLLRRILAQFDNPLIYVLLASAAITFVLGEYVDCGVILGVVLVNAVVGLVQESKAIEALESLRSMTRVAARVVRAGQQLAVPSEVLVPGDLVLLDAGDKVPADLRLVRAEELRVDESALTGESESVHKDPVVLPTDTRVADRHNMVHAGTLVRTGAGAGVVVATGAQTELGEIHRLVGGATPLVTPLTRKIASFSKVLTVAILALAAVAFVVGLARGEDAVEMFTAAVALAVGAIPEGLPAAVTVTLAIGVGRMARREAVIRRLPAVETLGSATVICTDKTGTLTTNQMTVRTVWTPDGDFSVSGTGYDPEGGLTDRHETAADPSADEALRWCLVAGAACNDASVSRAEGAWTVTGDPTEAAMTVVARKAGISPTDVLARERLATIPFDSRRQYMATLHARADGSGHVVLLKGAAERVVARCGSWLRADGRVEPLDRDRVAAAVEDLAGRGLRVLATARAADVSPDGFADERWDAELVLTGLQAMLDPPRPAASAAIAACHRAGVEVKMITGDHAGTAAAIAAELGLDHRPPDRRRVLTGTALSALPPEEYAEAVAATAVFARVSPEEKLRLVEALQARGHVVAMTGDGVNDAPALQQADIGIAMGRSGTEVAKDAADMVLLDDDFATIEAAVEEGRGVFDNLTKFIVWTLPTNMGEGLVILLAILLGAALPILPTQILWINMTTAAALGLMLAFEPREEGLMDRPPRAADLPLLTRDLVTRTLLVSAVLVAGSWWLFSYEQGSGASLAEARTAAVNVFVAVQVMYLFSCRSLTRPSRTLGLLTNRWIIGGVAVQVAGQLALTYLPVMNDIFKTAPLDGRAWGLIGLVAVASMGVVGLDKRWRGRDRPPAAAPRE